MRRTNSARLWLSGVILAAGTSTRLGRPKQLLPLGDRCMLQVVLDTACASGLEEIIVVLGHEAEAIRRHLILPATGAVRLLFNPAYLEGQSTSLRAGVRAASSDAAGAVVLLGDQPDVGVDAIDRLAAAFRAGAGPILRTVYCTADGRRVPAHPVLLGRQVWDAVESLRGDEGARRLMAAHPDWLVELECAGEPPEDVDRWEDYRRAIDRGRV